jgi:hypothetical protein
MLYNYSIYVTELPKCVIVWGFVINVFRGDFMNYIWRAERYRRFARTILTMLLFFCTSLNLASCGKPNEDREVINQKLTLPKKPEYKVVEIKKGKISREIKGPAIFVSAKQEELILS